MREYDWSRLNKLQVGRFAEYFVKMELTLMGLEVYTSEVDDRGIDFVIRAPNRQFYEVQVKSARTCNYIFFEQSKFCRENETLSPNRLAILVLLFDQSAPVLYLIQATEWLKPVPPLCYHGYENVTGGREYKSKPEYGINLSSKNLPLLDKYKLSGEPIALFTAISASSPALRANP